MFKCANPKNTTQPIERTEKKAEEHQENGKGGKEKAKKKEEVVGEGEEVNGCCFGILLFSVTTKVVVYPIP